MGNNVSIPPGRKLNLEDFDLVRLVGKGAFGKVWQVRKRDTGDIFAMKVLDKKTVIEQNLVAHTVLERDVMLMCNNPFIVNLYYAFQTGESLYFILDFVGGGSLFTVLRDHELGYFIESHARFYAAEILLGIEELHRHEIVYRDLKLENILLGTDGHIVLTDFGLSARLQDKNAKLHSFSGTSIYLAPEVLLGEGHNKNVDWWSYGVLLHLLLTGEPPFWSENRKELYEMIVYSEIIVDDPLLSPDSRDLIIRLLERDTKRRLGCSYGADEIKKHRFFSGINWNSVTKKKLKPPYIPQTEFLLTSRNEPIPLEALEEGGEENNHPIKQNDFDYFRGFSFAHEVVNADKQVFISNELNSTPFAYYDEKRLVKKKRKKRILPFEKLNFDTLMSPNPTNTSDAPQSSRGDYLTAQKLELLKEQAAKDNRNRKFISVGGGDLNTDESTFAQPQISPKSLGSNSQPKVSTVTRMSSAGDLRLDEVDQKKKKGKKKKETRPLTSPRKSGEHNKLCTKCSYPVTKQTSFNCKDCGTFCCNNCILQKTLPEVSSQEVVNSGQCINCYSIVCIKALRNSLQQNKV